MRVWLENFPSNQHVRLRRGMNLSQDYPSILKRYLSSFIDGLFVVGMFIGLSFLFSQDTQTDNTVRIAIFFIMLFCYEPICVSFFCTLGQKITGIRVRRVGTFQKIPLTFAFVRYFLKIFLGFISLFAIIFSEKRRAIHDFASGSIVIYGNEQV